MKEGLALPALIKKLGIIMLLTFIIALVAPFILDLALNKDETTVASAYFIPTGRSETEAPDSTTGRKATEAPESTTGRGSTSVTEDDDRDGRKGYSPPKGGSGRK